jgi:hypothetical protein
MGVVIEREVKKKWEGKGGNARERARCYRFCVVDVQRERPRAGALAGAKSSETRDENKGALNLLLSRSANSARLVASLFAIMADEISRFIHWAPPHRHSPSRSVIAISLASFLVPSFSSLHPLLIQKEKEDVHDPHAQRRGFCHIPPPFFLNANAASVTGTFPYF